MRLLVAAYLFMTGFGHFTFFYSKPDFSLFRTLNVLFRLNLLTALLSFATELNYLSYYFSPLVSMWYLIIWGTMRICPTWKDPWCLLKIAVALTISTLFCSIKGPIEFLAATSNTLIQTNWQGTEWRFRVALDKYIVFYGMILAYGKNDQNKVITRFSTRELLLSESESFR